MFCTFVLVSLACVVANGSITYIDQDRFVSADNDKGGSLGSVATGFEFFDESADLTWVPSQAAPQPLNSQPYYLAMGDQRSSLTAEVITAQGSVLDLPMFYHYEEFSQSAQSYFSVTFELDHPSDVSLLGILKDSSDRGGGGGGQYSFDAMLAEVGGTTLFSASHSNVTGDIMRLPVDERFSLDVGQYVLEINAIVEGWYGPLSTSPDEIIPDLGGGGEVAYEMTLTAVPISVPVPGPVPIPVPAALALLLPGLGTLTALRRNRFLS